MKKLEFGNIFVDNHDEIVQGMETIEVVSFK